MVNNKLYTLPVLDGETERQLFKDMLLLLPGIVFWKDVQGKIVGCNQGALQIFGFKSTDDCTGKTDLDFMDLQYANKIRQSDADVIKTGEQKTVEEVMIHADNQKHVYLTDKIPLRNASKDIVGVLCMSLDITEKIRQQQELFDALPSNIYWLDSNGKFLGCNKQLLNLLELKNLDEYVGKTYEDLYEHSHIAVIKQTDKKVMEADATTTLEETAIDKKGAKKFFLTEKTPLHDKNGKVSGLLGVSIDITQQKATEEELEEARMMIKLQEERIHMLQLFGASIAHELRTPLMTIFNYASSENFLNDITDGYKLAKKAKLPVKFIQAEHLKKGHEIFQHIQLNALRINDFIDTLLTNIKGFGGRAPREPFKLCAITQCIKKALDRYWNLYPEEKSLFEWDDGKGDFQFKGDPLMIEHLLFNLIKNAVYYIRAAQKGKISIWLEPGRETNRLYFQDTGQGISEEVKGHLFEAFFSRRKYGTGVGLAFCRWAIEDIGGKISCESVLGEFTRFIVEFPG